jgi:hypothetical protein
MWLEKAATQIDDEQNRAPKQAFCLTSDFVVLVLSEAVLSKTVLVLDGCLN